MLAKTCPRINQDRPGISLALTNHLARGLAGHASTLHVPLQQGSLSTVNPETRKTWAKCSATLKVTQADCVTRDITQVNYREHMRRSSGLKIYWKMEIKIDETYHVAICFVLKTYT